VPRRPRKLPKGLGSYTPLSPIGKDDWQRLECVFGEKLSDNVREEIFRGTKNYLLFESTERSAEPIKDAKKQIEVLQMAAAAFQSEMTSSAVSYSAAVLITRHFQDASLSEKSGGHYVGRFNSLNNVLCSFVAACERALGDLEPPASADGLLGDSGALPSWQEGAEWRKWIRQLNQIMEDNGLRARTRKDAGGKSKSDKQSPFTRFVWELQYLLPDGCGRHMHSIGALATAISRALKSRVK
jgi:hypothetical protein